MKYRLQVAEPPAAEPISLDEAKLHCRISGTDDDVNVAAFIAAARMYVENDTNRQLVAATYDLFLHDFCSRIYIPKAPLIEVTHVKYYDEDNTLQTVDSADYEVVDTDDASFIVEAYDADWPSSIYDRQDAVVIRFVAGHVAKVTAANATELFTVYGRDFADTDAIRLSVSGTTTAALPASLAALTTYYVRDWTSAVKTFKLAATSGGTALSITTDGTGTLFAGENKHGGMIPPGCRNAMRLLISHFNENREALLTGSISKKLEHSVDDLLRREKVWMGKR